MSIPTPHPITVCPDKTADRIREWLRENPEIAKDKYDAEAGSVYGHCYVASEAYFHSKGGEDSDLDVYCLSHEQGTHWFLKRDEVVIDLSIETVRDGENIPYEDATHRAFITGYEPSKRAEKINTELGLW